MGVTVQISAQLLKRQIKGLFKMAKTDQYADIDFEEINDQTGLANDEIKCLKVCFDLFDTKKQDYLSADDLGEIMRAMGFRPTEEELVDLVNKIDEDGSGQIEFPEFCQLCATFWWKTLIFKPLRSN